MQHSTSVAMGVRWLSRQCSVVLYESATAADEYPDVIGWVPGAESVVIECKLTRSDFLRPSLAAILGFRLPAGYAIAVSMAHPPVNSAPFL